MKLNNLKSVMTYAIRAKLMPFWVKIRRWVNPTYLWATLSNWIRKFFSKILDVRPRHAGDYHVFFSWMVSKRLSVAVVIGLAVCSLLYISAVLPSNFFSGESGGIKTYQYRSIPLKFYSGSVNIEGKGDYLAYSGEVEKGVAAGRGTLYARDGSTVYEGQFADSKYNGEGPLYYPSGLPHYTGQFQNNLFHGTGQYFWSSGALQYEGDYVAGVRSGTGTLYNKVGNEVFHGSFLADEIVYFDFLDRSTEQTSELYSGEVHVYQSDDEYCVLMPEIGAAYSVRDGSNTLDEAWTVERVLVLNNEITIDGEYCSSLSQLQHLMGTPLYFGTVWVDLTETVGWNTLAQEYPEQMIPIQISAEEGIENVFDVSGYDRDRQLYMYTFMYGGVLYSFYFAAAGESGFLMYTMEKA